MRRMSEQYRYKFFEAKERQPRRQTMEDLERSAAFRAEIHEAVEQYWTNMAKSEAEGAQRLPWWALLLAFLGAILSDGEDPQDMD